MNNNSTKTAGAQPAVDFFVADGVHLDGDRWIIVINGEQRAETTISEVRAEEIYAQILEIEEAIPVYSGDELLTFIFRIERPGFSLIISDSGTSYHCNHCEGLLDAPNYECQFCAEI